MIYQIRNRTETEDIVYALHLYFNGLSLRKTSRALSRFIKRSHTAIRDWIQKYKPERLFYRKMKISEFIVDETQIKVGSEFIWLWVVIAVESKEILGLNISKERNMFVAEHFLSGIVEEYGEHPVSTDGGTWYPQACQFLKLKHHIHIPLMRKVSLKEQCNISKIELKDLMITFHVERKIASLSMCNNG